MKRSIPFALVLIAAGCGEPDALPADQAPLSTTSEQELEADAKSIEQAADEAVKLIEADAKAEIDANAPAADAGNTDGSVQ